jgi:peptidyl-prolyl cis-trans isomerase B (cyclophilin B)
MKEKFTYAEIETDYGIMKVKLYNSTPTHRDNFVNLANEQFYDDLLFHRIIQGFMIQGGDPNSKGADQNIPLGAGGPGYKLDAEIGAYHFKGALAAARQGDNVNPEKKSSGSQFYIVQGVPQTEDRLNRIMEAKGIEYTQEEIDRYIEEGGTPALDGDYTVYGELVEGFDVLDKIAAVQTGRANRPVEDIKMKVRIVE